VLDKVNNRLFPMFRIRTKKLLKALHFLTELLRIKNVAAFFETWCKSKFNKLSCIRLTSVTNVQMYCVFDE